MDVSPLAPPAPLLRRQSLRRAVCLLPALLAWLWCAPAAAQSSKVLARVNGDAITNADIEFELLARNAKDEVPPEARRRILDQLIERKLILQDLEQRKIRPDSKQVDAQIKRLNDVIERSGADPKQVLGDLGYTPRKLRENLAYASMWRNFFQSVVSQPQLQQYFDSRKEHFDGTELRARQIFLKLPADADDAAVKAAVAKLQDYRRHIAAGEISFADAAKQWSQSPSAAEGGDVGFFPYRGKMPFEFSKAAFQIEVGQIGEPFRSPFGVHLVEVTDKRPGDFSLEDVRGIVVNELQQELWNGRVAQLRDKARIEILTD